MNKLWKARLSVLLCLSLIAGLLSSLAMEKAAAAEPVTETIAPSDDAAIDITAKDTNFSDNTGGSIGIFNLKRNRAQSEVPTQARLGFYKFPVTDAAQVESAQFKLTGKIGSNPPAEGVTFTVYGIVNDAWSESNLTWNTASNIDPSTGDISGAGVSAFELGTFNIAANQTAEIHYVIDATDFVNNYGVDGYVTFIVADVGGANGNVSLYTKENTSASRHPELRLTRQGNTEPEPPGSTATKLEVLEVTASGHDGNFPENTLDDDLNTRWSAQSALIDGERTGQWIQYDLGSVKTVGYLGIAFASGDRRSTFFDIKLSLDGVNFTKVFEGQSGGTTLGLEPFDVADQDARYVRITGYGNTANLWNSLTDVHIYPPHPDGLVLADLNPPPPEVPGDTTPYTIAGMFDNKGNPYPLHTPNAVTGSTINVTDPSYGAIPDDGLDDTAAINAAIAAALPGDEIYFPNGTYDLISTLSNDATSHIALKNGVNMRGESQSGAILRSHFDRNTANSKVMNAFGLHDIVISYLTLTSTFDGPYSTNHQANNPDRGGPENMIYIEDRLNQPSYNITIDSVTIEKFQRMGVRISKSRDVVVKNSLFQNATDVGGGGAGYGVSIQGIAKVDRLGYANDSRHNVVENSQFVGPYMRHGVLIQFYSHNNEVRHNDFDGMRLDAIDLHGEDEYLNRIDSNQITGVLTGAGIALGNTGGAAPSNHDASGPFNHIVNNTITNSREGIKVHLGSPDTLIEGNTISGTTEPSSSKGIYIQNAPRTIIRNNTITNNTASGFWGIVLEHDNGDANAGNVGKGDPEDIVIEGNTITGNSNGVRIDAGTYTLAASNTISGNLGVDFVDNVSENIPEEPEPFPVPDPVIEGNKVTITAMADSMIRDGAAYTNMNFGTETMMKIKERVAPNSGYERRVFLKFDLDSLNGEIESATLMLYNNKLESGNPDGYHVTAQGIEDDSWTEMKITEANQPQSATDLDNVHVTQNEAYVEFDVTDFVSAQTDGIASFRLVGVEDNLGADYASRENTSLNMPPLLVVTLKQPAEELTSIRIADVPPLVAGGDGYQAQVIGVFSDGTERPIVPGVEFSMSHPQAAAVSSDGLITPLAAGTTKIIATYGEYTAEQLVHVYAYYYEATAKDDTYVRTGLAAQGKQPTMNIKSNSSGSDVRRAYLKFELPEEYDFMVDRAVVKVFVTELESSTPSDGYQITIFGLNDDTWNEAELVHDNQPAAAAAAVALSTVQVNSVVAGTYIEFDVTEFVREQKDEAASFFIQSAGPASRGAHYAAKEHELGKPPLLVITQEAAAPPAQVAVKSGNGVAELTWSKVSSAVTYKVMRSVQADGPYEVVGETSTLQYKDRGLINGVDYYYVVTSVNKNGESEPSAPVRALPAYPITMGTPRFTNGEGDPVSALHGGGFLRTVADLTNITEEAQSVTFIVALYNGTTMDSLAYVEKSIGAGKTATFETGFHLPDNPSGYYVKLFVWDSFSGMVPVSDPIIFPAEG
ncbi:CBM96 family carbohydrate-binding protein [Paenibacillus sp. IITD108]|uniref:CBM96 family carbohydrate-binding protein n=1 Tax=Paenibacillus sp. IITD108 TaxID=3116649 RepID=UPI002F4023BF